MEERVQQAYLETFKQFRDDYNSGIDETHTMNTLAYLSKMRHIVGISKIDPCLDFLMEFLGSCDRKITVFFHHKDVGEILFQKLSILCKELGLDIPLRIISEMNSEERYNSVHEFTNNSKNRVLIASTLAAGEGLNLQVCSDFIILERQWNPANEEQAEARFPRPGQTATSIQGTYFVAVGTVDEFFAEIVERKRSIVTSTLNGTEAIEWDQSSIIKELAEILVTKGGQRWQC
jgi:SNF2 family DNA or RNA helicase